MNLRLAVFIAITAFFVMGCCSSTVNTPSSSSCQYGTYGESCTKVCDKLSQDPNCFTNCMEQVRAAGLGDATTCCKTSVGAKCQSQCSALATSTQGDTTEMECMDECTAAYSSQGITADTCGDIPW